MELEGGRSKRDEGEGCGSGEHEGHTGQRDSWRTRGSGEAHPEGERCRNEELAARMMDETRAQRTRDRPHVEHGGREPASATRAMKGLFGQNGKHDGKVERQQPHQGHHHQRQPQLLATAGIAQAIPDPGPPPEDGSCAWCSGRTKSNAPTTAT